MGVAKHNLENLQDDNGLFLADELCRTDPLLVQKYEEKLVIEADNGPVPLMTGVQVKADADFPPVDNSGVFNIVAGENTNCSEMPSMGDTGSDTDESEEELDMAAVYSATLHVHSLDPNQFGASFRRPPYINL